MNGGNCRRAGGLMRIEHFLRNPGCFFGTGNCDEHHKHLITVSHMVERYLTASSTTSSISLPGSLAKQQHLCLYIGEAIKLNMVQSIAYEAMTDERTALKRFAVVHCLKKDTNRQIFDKNVQLPALPRQCDTHWIDTVFSCHL